MKRKMGKSKIGTMKNKILVEGDANLLGTNEILVTKSEGYTILRERMSNGNIKTYAVVPLEDFSKTTVQESDNEVESIIITEDGKS